MSRSLRIVHAPVPNPVLRFAALVNKPTTDADLTKALADWNGTTVVHSLPGDWPGDDPTLASSPPPGGTWVRGQGTYTGVDPNLIVTPRILANGATLVWQALWLYDASAPALSNQCPPIQCPPCPTCPGGVTPPSSSSSLGTLAALFTVGLVAGAGTAYASTKGRK